MGVDITYSIVVSRVVVGVWLAAVLQVGEPSDTRITMRDRAKETMEKIRIF